jgi:GNAT superfamily N-acetyltransferase
MIDPASEHVVTLRDGSRALIRPIRASDKAALAEGLERLSPASRYRRFLRPVTSLNDRELRYLTEVDYTNHFAWVAVDPDQPGEPGLGVARYVRDPKDPEVAEAAVAVVDDHQGIGLGGLLLQFLVASAVANGIATFRGWVLGDNVEVLRPLERIGARRRPDHGVIRIEVDLTADFDDSPVRETLRAVARGEFSPEPGD